jgi:hypothetical protein
MHAGESQVGSSLLPACEADRSDCLFSIAIFAGYILGTSLSPEAKTYRLLADVFNDCALILDTLSPFFNTLDQYALLPPGSGSLIRAVALCTSACLRALCGFAAQSKAQLTLHFATAGAVPGDIGDLNSKDGSKETVLALFGSLVCTVVTS